ncbi:MAG: N(1)-aminopropylagmatine ureohydrolase [Promethearchaeota archaeon]|nr:MAG: N(1)-aminopropylagmatine ureohydrolase [Candidatus Lokiarchaeota archaeon]
MKFFDYGEVITRDTEFVVFGIPWDEFTSIEIASSAPAPNKLREVSQHLALGTELGMEIPNFKVVDIGNVTIIPENASKNLEAIQHFVDAIYAEKEDIILIVMGGDHFCSYPVIKSVGARKAAKNDFGVLVFDAHLDFYEEYDNTIYSHAAVSHRIYDLDFIGSHNLLIAGTRDVDIPEMKLAQKENLAYLNAHEAFLNLREYINNIISFFKTSKINQLYISIDIDALDPSTAPGTGYAIPGGFSYRELWTILKNISEEFQITGFDVVEVSPNLDLPNHITVNLAAKLITELISFISPK